MSNKIAEISQNNIQISLSENEEDPSPIKISIKNITNSFIIFKAFINKKSLLLVKPSFYFIPPLKTYEISIKPLETDPSKYEEDPLKLLLLFVSSSPIDSIDQAKKIFQEKRQDKSQKQELILDININNGGNNGIKINKKKKEIKEKSSQYYEEKYYKMKRKLFKEKEKIEKSIEKENKELIAKKEKLFKDIENRELPKEKNKKKIKMNSKACECVYIVLIILLGLIIGANLANIFNKILKWKNNKKMIIEDNKIIETNETFIQNRTEDNFDNNVNITDDDEDN